MLLFNVFIFWYFIRRTPLIKYTCTKYHSGSIYVIEVQFCHLQNNSCDFFLPHWDFFSLSSEKVTHTQRNTLSWRHCFTYYLPFHPCNTYNLQISLNSFGPPEEAENRLLTPTNHSWMGRRYSHWMVSPFWLHIT